MMPAPFSSEVPFSVTLNVLKSTRFSSSPARSAGRPRSCDLLAHPDAVDRALELVQGDEVRDRRRVVLDLVLLELLRLEDEIAVDLLVEDLLAQRLLRRLEVCP